MDSPATATDTAHRVCVLCGEDNASGKPSRFSKDSWVLKTCSSCDFLYLENAPDYERLEVEFAWEKTSAAVTEERTESNPTVGAKVAREMKQIRRAAFPGRNKIGDLVARHLPREPGVLVDIGCGTGTPLQVIARALQDAGHEVEPVGIEISRQLSEGAHKKFKKLGGRALFADALSGLSSLEAGSVIGVVMSSYLEHEIHPRAVLEATSKCLRKGGVVIVKVPNFACINRVVAGGRWCGFRYPDHVNYFTPSSLRRIALEAGLEVASFRVVDRLPTSDNMYAVLRKE